MAGIGKYKLADALRNQASGRSARRGSKPEGDHRTAAEQVREAQESRRARDAEASGRERAIDHGRGGQQAGRRGS